MPAAINNPLVMLQEQHIFLCFFSDVGFRQSAMMAALIEASRDLYDGDIQSIPMPPDVPPEIPRVILRDRHGFHEVSVSPDRLIVSLRSNGYNSPDAIDAARMRACEFATSYARVNSGRVNRIALNRIRVLDGTDGAMRLVRYFVKPSLSDSASHPHGPLSRCENFEIHAHKRYSITEGLIINSWVRCKTAIKLPEKAPAISIEQDLNTLGEETDRRFEIAQVQSVYERMIPEADSIFNLYFPQGLQP